MDPKHEEKKAFVERLGEVLRLGRDDIKELHLSEAGDYVSVEFTDGYRKCVCIAADSYLAIVADVVRVCM